MQVLITALLACSRGLRMQVLITALPACSRGRWRSIDAPTTAARARGSGNQAQSTALDGIRSHDMIAWEFERRHERQKVACCALCCARRDAPRPGLMYIDES